MTHRPSQATVLAALSAQHQLDSLLLDCIDVSGAAGCPAGELFARLMGKLSLRDFEAWIDRLVIVGMVLRDGDLLFVGRRPIPAKDLPAAIMASLSGESRSVQRRIAIQRGEL